MAGEILTNKEEFKELNIKISGLEKRLKYLNDRVIGRSHGLILVTLLFVAWEILPRVGIISSIFFPPFSETLFALKNLVLSGELFFHIKASMERSLIGFGLAAIVAIPLGFLMGWYARFEKYTDLLIQSLRNTSQFALLPLFILLLGIGEVSKIAIVFYSALFFMLINTITGVKNVDPLYIKAAKSFGISNYYLFRKVILPGSIPSIIAGARLSAKSAVMVVIGAEMLAAKSGLGYFIQDSQLMFRIPDMYAGILTLTIIGVSMNYILIWIEKRATYWKGDLDSAIL